MSPEKVVLAEIVRTRGIRGELIARSQTDIPGRLANLKKGSLALTNGSDLPVAIASAWQHKGDWVLKLEGVDSIESAEPLLGADLWVPLSERGRLEDGEFFCSDLLGCKLIDERNGECIGVVEGWQQYGGPPLMEVRSGKQERLVPFVNHLCKVDLSARTIHAELPEGLLDL